MNMFTFGYSPLASSLISWGARAIFNSRSDRPLDLLPDRQQISRDGQSDEQVAKFLRVINTDKKIVEWMQSVAKHFSPDSSEKFCRVYSYDDGLALVAQGSPQSSYGYFYLSISLVPVSDIPNDIRPDIVAENDRLDRQQREREYEQRNAEYAREHRAGAAGRRAEKKAAHSQFDAQGWCDMVAGEAFVPGMRCTINANQADRDAVCIDVSQTGALLQYIMPNGRRFLWEVALIAPATGTDICCIRTMSSTSLPSRYAHILPQFKL
jgi:hypothetical protein